MQLLVVFGVLGYHERFPLVRQCLPNFLGDKRHERVQKLECFGKNIQKHPLRIFLCLFIVAVKAGLCKLNVPVAVAVPDKVVYLACGNAQLKAVHVIADFLDDLIEL